MQMHEALMGCTIHARAGKAVFRVVELARHVRVKDLGYGNATLQAVCPTGGAQEPRSARQTCEHGPLFTLHGVLRTAL